MKTGPGNPADLQFYKLTPPSPNPYFITTPSPLRVNPNGKSLFHADAQGNLVVFLKKPPNPLQMSKAPSYTVQNTAQAGDKLKKMPT